MAAVPLFGTRQALADAAALARHANAKVTAQVYAAITDRGSEAAASKLVAAGFRR